MKVSIFLSCLSLLFSGSALAAEIQVVDCTGVTRAMLNSDSELGHLVTVTLKTTDKASVEIPLKNTRSGDILKALSSDGVVTFRSVSEGVWSICPLPQNVSISDITITPMPSDSSYQVATLGGVAIGGAALLGASLGSSGSDNSEVALNTNDNSPAPGSLSGPKPAGNTGSNHPADKDTRCITAAAQALDNPCRVGDKPVPVSPFS